MSALMRRPQIHRKTWRQPRPSGPRRPLRPAVPTARRCAEIESSNAGKAGGAGGIRTLDTPLQAYNGLANRRLQPLGHSSDAHWRTEPGLTRQFAYAVPRRISAMAKISNMANVVSIPGALCEQAGAARPRRSPGELIDATENVRFCCAAALGGLGCNADAWCRLEPAGHRRGAGRGRIPVVRCVPGIHRRGDELRFLHPRPVSCHDQWRRWHVYAQPRICRPSSPASAETSEPAPLKRKRYLGSIDKAGGFRDPRPIRRSL